MYTIKKIVVFFFIILSNSLDGQIAFPGAEGYGATTRGAYSGSSSPDILIVDNLRSDETGDENTGRGSFLWCLNRPYPRIILFEVSGTIDYRTLEEPIVIKYPYLTIAGQTAPGSGITIRGTAINVSNQSQTLRNQAHDVIIQHIRIRHGDDPQGTEYNERDCITLNGDNIIIDHCSFSWSVDNIVGLGTCNNVTLSNCIFSEPLHYSYHFREADNHRPERHGFAMLIRKCTNLSIVKNLFAYSFERNPLTRAESVAIINNLMYNSNGCKMGAIIDGTEFPAIQLLYQGNVVLRTQQTTCRTSKYAAMINSNVGAESRLYFYDNICVKSLEDSTLSEWDKIYSRNDDIQPVDDSPLSKKGYMIIKSSEVEEYILKYVGAKPDNRDLVDLRIVDNVKNRTGEYINSPYPLPARAYNFDYADTETDNGNFVNGFDWSDSPQIIVIESDTIYLNQKCANIDDIFNLLNPQLPDYIETYQVHGGYYIGFRTKESGISQSIEVSGNGLNDFGIPEGTYLGSDGVGGYPVIEELIRTLSGMVNYPGENPHNDDNNNGYSNLEDWIHQLYVGYDSLIDYAANEICTVYPNPANDFINVEFNNTTDIKFPLKIKIYNTLGELVKILENINNYQIKVEDLGSTNMYVMSIFDSNDRLIYTNKFMVFRQSKK